MVQEFHHPYGTVFQACRNALNDLEFETKYASRDDRYIGASSSTSLLSWGENIEINIGETTVGGNTRVEVNSYSQAQLISWGKNKENEEAILDRVEYLLSRR